MSAMQAEKFMTVKEAADFVTNKMGLPTTYQAMRTRADTGKLPFFQEPGSKRRIIAESALIEVYMRRQIEAKRAAR